MTGGILVVDKPPGATSFDIVRMVRKETGVKRVGHGGTLDPAATGVLLVLLGQAARVSDYLMDLPKTYVALVRLGVETDTYDAEGETVSEHDVTATTEDVRRALAAFEGEVEQVPPAYSALKVEGKRAYDLARRGETVALRPRKVQVYRVALLRYDPPLAEIEVECGRGTYIRSLAHDLGAALGCGAHLAALRRTRIGPFTAESALNEERLREVLADGSWRQVLQPTDAGLVSLPGLTVRAEAERDLRHGQAVRLDAATTGSLPPLTDGREARCYAEDGSLIGILRYDAATGAWRPRKIFA